MTVTCEVTVTFSECWKSDLGDEEILERLLKLNLERSKGGK